MSVPGDGSGVVCQGGLVSFVGESEVWEVVRYMVWLSRARCEDMMLGRVGLGSIGKSLAASADIDDPWMEWSWMGLSCQQARLLLAWMMELENRQAWACAWPAGLGTTGELEVVTG